MPKQCEFEICKGRATYGFNNEKTYCKEHKEEGMKYYNNRKCECGKQPHFNYPNEKTPICCSNCKKEGMIDIIHDKCPCGTRPNFNFPNENIAICCSNCKKEGMIDIKSPKCKANEQTACNQRGNIKYKGYCTMCYQHLFPLDPLTFQIRLKSKEITVRDFINQNFNGFQHDKIMTTSHCDCSIRRRIDHRIQIGNTLLCVETDENQHKSYDKKDEEIRYDDLYNAFSGKWVYIRFNPDSYIENGKRKHTSIATRLTKLKKEIEYQMKRIQNEENTELLEIKKMYYDN